MTALLRFIRAWDRWDLAIVAFVVAIFAALQLTA